MTNNYKPPNSPAGPPAYGSDYVASPQAAHMQPYPPQQQQQGDFRGASPYQGNGYPPPGGPQHQQQNNGYYAPGPQMGYAPQGQYQQQQHQQGGYGPGMYPPQGQYGNQGRQGGSKGGFLGACLGALACCCCLDCLF